MPYISVVTPVYNAVNIVDELYARLVENLEKITSDFEIIMVNDACPHGSGKKIAALAQKDKRVKFIDLARNFGQHIAISAGLDYAEGDYVVVMDCDLQDPPEKIGVMLDELQKSGKEVIFAIRQNRKDSFIKKLESKIFNVIIRILTDKIYNEKERTVNFSIITHKVVLAYRRMKERRRDYSSIVRYCGFKWAYIFIEGQERFEGESSYTFIKSVRHAISIVLQQSVKPLFISVFLSACCFLISCVYGISILYNKINGCYDADGYTGIIFVVTLIGALIFFVMSVTNLYISAIFDEVRARPLYIVNNKINIDKDI